MFGSGGGVSCKRPLLFMEQEERPESDRGDDRALVTVGMVLKEWGVRGEVLARSLTFDPARFLELREVVIECGGSREGRTIESVSLRKGRLVLKLSQCETPEDARRYRGATIRIRQTESPPLPEGVFYHYQIEGLEVYTTAGVCLGRVVEIMETGSNDVYVVQGRGQEHLIPAIRDVIASVDLNAGRMVVRPLAAGE